MIAPASFLQVDILDPGSPVTEEWAALPLPPGGLPEAPVPDDVRRLIVRRGDQPLARVGLGARVGFAGARGRTGFVGWYAATDPEAGTLALRTAARALDRLGADRVVGPMNGTTWYRYRVTLPREEEIEGGEPFIGEPLNPADWAEHFENAGYKSHLEYETRLVRHPAADPALIPVRSGLEQRGIRFRTIDPDRFEEELTAVYDLSTTAFGENPYFTPISFTGFQALYAGVRAHLDPALVRLAEADDGQLLGYAFAFPDLQPSTDSHRVVLKTLAVDPAARGLRLGAILVDQVNAAAAERGASVVHALMQVGNASRRISGHSGSELFRRYRLYQWQPD